ncbi:PKD domain-containing protein [Nonlabens marinus]|uniref:Beta-glucanase n=1 Tax=Nonlabens marinus S1-08 TaxID=1454201 RepID=W8VQ68_9FLAO|nr:PKD domain-containing protein [Nonlabens marinus]BAO54890.1 beta-glucanase precursor [Nonlabens marinus S1-08]
MKYLYKLMIVLTLAVSFQSCQEDDTEFGDIITPSNLNVNVAIQGESSTDPNGDGTGIVVFSSTADNALNYTYDFGDGRTGSTFNGAIEHRFVDLGVNSYSVTVTATGTAGAATTQTFVIDVLSTFDDSEAKEFLTGGSSKTWYWSVAENGHWGVGPTLLIGGQSPESYYTPAFFPVPAFGRYCNELTECFYEDEMIFTMNGNNVIFELKNFGSTYFHNSYLSQFGGPSANNPDNADECLPFTAPAPGTVTFTPTTNTDVPEDRSRKTSMLLANNNFMSWYVGSSEYEILEITENRMVLRTVQANDPALAWYHTLTTDVPVNPNPSCI